MARSNFSIGRLVDRQSIENLNVAVDKIFNRFSKALVPIKIPDTTFLEIAGKFGAGVLQSIIKEGDNSAIEDALSQTGPIKLRANKISFEKTQLNSPKYSDMQIKQQSKLLGIDAKSQRKLSLSLEEAGDDKFIPDEFARCMGDLSLNFFKKTPSIDLAWLPMSDEDSITNYNKLVIENRALDIVQQIAPIIEVESIQLFER